MGRAGAGKATYSRGMLRTSGTVGTASPAIVSGESKVTRSFAPMWLARPRAGPKKKKRDRGAAGELTWIWAWGGKEGGR